MNSSHLGVIHVTKCIHTFSILGDTDYGVQNGRGDIDAGAQNWWGMVIHTQKWGTHL